MSSEWLYFYDGVAKRISSTLGDWKEVYAEAVSSTVEENLPDRWEPLFGWKHSLPSAAQLKQTARAKAAAQAAAKADAASLVASRRAFKPAYNKCRKCVKHGVEMRSISVASWVIIVVRCRFYCAE